MNKKSPWLTYGCVVCLLLFAVLGCDPRSSKPVEEIIGSIFLDVNDLTQVVKVQLTQDEITKFMEIVATAEMAPDATKFVRVASFRICHSGGGKKSVSVSKSMDRISVNKIQFILAPKSAQTLRALLEKKWDAAGMDI